ISGRSLDRRSVTGAVAWASAVRLVDDVRRFVSKQLCVVGALVGAEPDVVLVRKGARIESARGLPVGRVGVHAHGSEIRPEHGLNPAPDRFAQWTTALRRSETFRGRGR